MSSYKNRIKKISKKNGKIILACDPSFKTNIENKTIRLIEKLKQDLCAIKLNMHLLLPLGFKSINRIIKIAHKSDLQVIADIKLNDIGNTNTVTAEILWSMGFDAMIVNPIIGLDNLKKLVDASHKKNKGVIALCHMSSKESTSYDIRAGKSFIYQIFLKWAIKTRVDGIIVGSTFPKIISECKKKSKNSLDIYSPGIGIQGGNVVKTMNSGTKYAIIGRSIINSNNPLKAVKDYRLILDK